MKKLLKQVVVDRKEGLVLDQHQIMMIKSDWLRLYGTGGCDHYPYINEQEMTNDLLGHYKIQK